MSMQADGLVLRDIHAMAAPSWWPPAPGWWLVLAAVALVVAVALVFLLSRRRRRRAVARLFDDTVAAAGSPAARIAAMSELLRRAARRRDRDADTLQGEDWLRFLDAGLKRPVFAAAGSLLQEGGYRRDVAEADAERLRLAARARFIDWMASR